MWRILKISELPEEYRREILKKDNWNKHWLCCFAFTNWLVGYWFFGRRNAAIMTDLSYDKSFFFNIIEIRTSIKFLHERDRRLTRTNLIILATTRDACSWLSSYPQYCSNPQYRTDYNRCIHRNCVRSRSPATDVTALRIQPQGLHVVLIATRRDTLDVYAWRSWQ